MSKENLFIKSAQRDKLLDAAQSMIPSIEVIIKELYNEVYKNDIEECLNSHFGKSNEIEIYIYENYHECLSLVLILKDKEEKMFMSNFETNIDNILDKYKYISLFSKYLDLYCEIYEDIKDLFGINGVLIKVK